MFNRAPGGDVDFSISLENKSSVIEAGGFDGRASFSLVGCRFLLVVLLLLPEGGVGC